MCYAANDSRLTGSTYSESVALLEPYFIDKQAVWIIENVP